MFLSTEEQKRDFHRLAESLAIVSEHNAVIKQLGAKYMDWVLEHEDELKSVIVIDGFKLSLKLSRKLIAEEI